MTNASPARRDVRFILGQLRPRGPLAQRRRALLPAWIRFFSWLFLLGTLGGPIWVLNGLLFHAPVNLLLFGFHYAGYGFDAGGFLLAIMFLFMGTAAYGLPWGRSWGLFLGLMAGVGGLFLALSSLFLADTPGLHIPLEPFFQVPFIVALWRRRAAWAEHAGDDPPERDAA